MNEKRVSVCLATYNGEKHIYEQLQSILYQLSEQDEVIISDDHSKDRTLEIIRSFADPRIRIVMNTGKKGYTGNFENALRYAEGDYIFFSDQDDVWMNDKVERCLFYLSDYDFVVSDAIVKNDSGVVVCDSYLDYRQPYSSFLGNLYRFSYLGCCFAFKRKVLIKSLPFPCRHDLCTHDNWMFLTSILFFRVKILSEKLIVYRRHGDNTSTGGFANKTSLGFKIKYRFYLLVNLMKLVFRR